jgi:hypothetical protein
MGRSAAMTLGAMLLLGGVTNAGAEDVSSFLSGISGAYPSLPQNWADLPFQLTAGQTVQYNSNLFNTPSNAVATYGSPVGSLISTTSVGASTTFRLYGQEFFANETYSLYRYPGHDFVNSNHNSGGLGMNWVAGQRCNGKVALSYSSSPALPNEQIGVNVLNTVTSQSVSQSTTCLVSGNWSSVFNAGWSKSNNSATVDEVNNFQNEFVAAGINYNVSETNSLQLLATVSHYNYPDRALFLENFLGSLSPEEFALENAALTSAITTEQINLTYTKTFNPNLSVIASIGAVSSTGNGSVGNSGIEPQFSLSANWSITPKLNLVASVARVITPPTSVAGNIQTNEDATVNLNYAITPKLRFTAGLNANRATSGLGTTETALEQQLFSTFSQSRTYSLTGGLQYSMTPFLVGSLNYEYVKRSQPDLDTTNNIFTLALSYSPH